MNKKGDKSANVRNRNDSTDDSDSFLEEVKARTGIRVNSVGELVDLVQTKTDKDFTRRFSRDENSEKLRLQKIIEDLNETIYDLEAKCRSTEKKYVRRLKEKEDEIDDLNEEINRKMQKKPLDAKNRTRLNELIDKNEELEIELEKVKKERNSSERKLKDVTESNEALSLDIENRERQIEELKSELRNSNNKKDDEIKDLKLQIEENEKEVIHLNSSITKLKENLEDEIRKYEKLENIFKEQGDEILSNNEKILNLERDIENYKSLLDEKTKEFEELKVVKKPECIRVPCQKCHRTFTSVDIDKHVAICET